MRALALLPAHNESASLAAVLKEIRDCHPDLDILVVDDSSNDATQQMLPELETRWIRLGTRLGAGGAVRRGLQYARSCGYDTVIRLDADGQHVAAHISDLLERHRSGQSDPTVTTHQIWSLLYLELWCQEFLDKSPVAQTGRPLVHGTSR